MKTFIDTNVILDLYFPDRGGQIEAAQIVDLARKDQQIRVYISILSVANTAYSLRKRVGKEESVKCMKELFHSVNTLPMSDMCYYNALKSDCPDFEDALQIFCADDGNCDVIITRDKKHFGAYTDIPIYTPKEFIAKLEATASTTSTSCI